MIHSCTILYSRLYSITVLHAVLQVEYSRCLWGTFIIVRHDVSMDLWTVHSVLLKPPPMCNTESRVWKVEQHDLPLAAATKGTLKVAYQLEKFTTETIDTAASADSLTMSKISTIFALAAQLEMSSRALA